jgi:thiamine-phosphate pyrophosphorylase
MPEPSARLYLLTPVLRAADDVAPKLGQACATGAVAAVLLRFAPADERTLVNQIKTLVTVTQEHGAAALVAVDGEVDLAAVAVRGGADGVHTQAGIAAVRDLRQRLKGDRIVGAGNLRSKHEAMETGEAEVDYVMFGEPRPDGFVPPFDTVVERAAWWAEIFQIPCVAYAPSLDAVSELARTGAEFIAVGDTIWSHEAGPAAAITAVLERCTTEAAE